MQSSPVHSRALAPTRDGAPSANGSALGNDDMPLTRPWADSDGRATRQGSLQSSIAAQDATSARGRKQRIGLQANYWRYLQHVTGPDADPLSPAEVLEFLLHFSGVSKKSGESALELLNRFGSLGAVVAADPAKLREVLPADELSILLLKAVRVAVKTIVREPLEDRPVIGSASALMDYLSVTMRHEPTEVTRILFLDRKNALIKDEIQHRGTVDHAPLYPREVVKRVVELGASAIILVHNHLSGDPTPSQSDVEMTCQLAAALSTINVALHDHVIVGRNKEVSLRKSRLIQGHVSTWTNSRRATATRSKPRGDPRTAL